MCLKTNPSRPQRLSEVRAGHLGGTYASKDPCYEHTCCDPSWGVLERSMTRGSNHKAIIIPFSGESSGGGHPLNHGCVRAKAPPRRWWTVSGPSLSGGNAAAEREEQTAVSPVTSASAIINWRQIQVTAAHIRGDFAHGLVRACAGTLTVYLMMSECICCLYWLVYPITHYDYIVKQKENWRKTVKNMSFCYCIGEVCCWHSNRIGELCNELGGSAVV